MDRNTDRDIQLKNAAYKNQLEIGLRNQVSEGGRIADGYTARFLRRTKQIMDRRFERSLKGKTQKPSKGFG